jgi:hypothetical protein
MHIKQYDSGAFSVRRLRVPGKPDAFKVWFDAGGALCRAVCIDRQGQSARVTDCDTLHELQIIGRGIALNKQPGD